MQAGDAVDVSLTNLNGALDALYPGTVKRAPDNSGRYLIELDKRLLWKRSIAVGTERVFRPLQPKMTADRYEPSDVVYAGYVVDDDGGVPSWWLGRVVRRLQNGYYEN